MISLYWKIKGSFPTAENFYFLVIFFALYQALEILLFFKHTQHKPVLNVCFCWWPLPGSPYSWDKGVTGTALCSDLCLVLFLRPSNLYFPTWHPLPLHPSTWLYLHADFTSSLHVFIDYSLGSVLPPWNENRILFGCFSSSLHLFPN